LCRVQVDVDDGHGAGRLPQREADPKVAVDDVTSPPVDDDVLDPTDLGQHPGERVLLRLRMEAPVRGVGEEPLGCLFAVADDPVGPCGRGHQAAPLVSSSP